MLPIFQRWESEFEKVGETFPVTITDDEKAEIQDAFAEPFNQSAKALADQLDLPIDEPMAATSQAFLLYFAGEFCDAIVDSTNRWIQRLEAEQQEKAIRLIRTLFKKIKEQVLSASRAAVIGITEVTRMATAGERLVASVWNRLFGKPKAIEGEAAEREPETAEEIFHRLVPRFYTAGDEKVCQVCQPVDGLYEWEWPSYAKGGSPLHSRCRCFQEWEKVPSDKIPTEANLT